MYEFSSPSLDVFPQGTGWLRLDFLHLFEAARSHEEAPGTRVVRKHLKDNLTRRFSPVSYAVVPDGAELAHFRVSEEIARDLEIVECRG